jgi:hypothetical protein
MRDASGHGYDQTSGARPAAGKRNKCARRHSRRRRTSRPRRCGAASRVARPGRRPCTHYAASPASHEQWLSTSTRATRRQAARHACSSTARMSPRRRHNRDSPTSPAPTGITQVPRPTSSRRTCACWSTMTTPTSAFPRSASSDSWVCAAPYWSPTPPALSSAHPSCTRLPATGLASACSSCATGCGTATGSCPRGGSRGARHPLPPHPAASTARTGRSSQEARPTARAGYGLICLAKCTGHPGSRASTLLCCRPAASSCDLALTTSAGGDWVAKDVAGLRSAPLT